jgi:D-beta-D-heptose 7-phosphate kinase / D-beta-D-heptose 1-phosphate adenosyltransferase
VPHSFRDNGLGIQVPDIARSHILVAGEVVLDRYVFGDTDRISPEAPIPVLHVHGYEERPGNAAFVCANLAALGALPTVLSVVGADQAGHRLRSMLTASGINTTALVEDPSRPTILKERLLGSVQSAQRATQQLLRVDHEDTRPLTDGVESQLRQRLEFELDRVEGVLVCDIGKGMLTAGLLRAIIDGARRRGKPVVIDPRRTEDYSVYRGATALTPNRYETERATGLDLRSRASWEAAARRLIESCELAACLITLDRDGVFVAQRGGAAVQVETTPREVYDVTGAGDVVLAVFGLFLIEGVDLEKAAMLANIAAGLEVSKQGAAVISRSEIMLALGAAQGSGRKLLPMDQLVAELNRQREAGRSICFAYGSFYPFRAEHIELLEFARAQADLLVVGTHGNGRIRRRKDGSVDQARIVAGIEAVDYVVRADDSDIESIIQSVRPDVLVGSRKRAGGALGVADLIKNCGRKLVLAQAGVRANSRAY